MSPEARRKVGERFRGGPEDRLPETLAFPEQFRRADVAKEPEGGMFEGRSQANGAAYVGVGRRLQTAPLDCLPPQPGGVINRPVIDLLRRVTLWCIPVVLLFLGLGILVLRGLLRGRRAFGEPDGSERITPADKRITVAWRGGCRAGLPWPAPLSQARACK